MSFLFDIRMVQCLHNAEGIDDFVANQGTYNFEYHLFLIFSFSGRNFIGLGRHFAVQKGFNILYIAIIISV